MLFHPIIKMQRRATHRTLTAFGALKYVLCPGKTLDAGYSDRNGRLNWQTGSAPLGKAALHSSCVQTQLPKAGDRLVGIDAVRPATIGNDFGSGVQGRRHCIQPAKVDLHRSGNVTHGKFIFRSHVQQGHRAVRQSGSKFRSTLAGWMQWRRP